MGFTAVGHLTPFLDSRRGAPLFQTHAQKIGDAIDTVREYRRIAGHDMDLCIEDPSTKWFLSKPFSLAAVSKSSCRCSWKIRSRPIISMKWRMSPTRSAFDATGERMTSL